MFFNFSEYCRPPSKPLGDRLLHKDLNTSALKIHKSSENVDFLETVPKSRLTLIPYSDLKEQDGSKKIEDPMTTATRTR